MAFWSKVRPWKAIGATLGGLPVLSIFNGIIAGQGATTGEIALARWRAVRKEDAHCPAEGQTYVIGNPP
jgi:hypothetical protein